jgi:hypothetical protein
MSEAHCAACLVVMLRCNQHHQRKGGPDSPTLRASAPLQVCSCLRCSRKLAAAELALAAARPRLRQSSPTTPVSAALLGGSQGEWSSASASVSCCTRKTSLSFPRKRKPITPVPYEMAYGFPLSRERQTAGAQLSVRTYAAHCRLTETCCESIVYSTYCVRIGGKHYPLWVFARNGVESRMRFGLGAIKRKMFNKNIHLHYLFQREGGAL